MPKSDILYKKSSNDSYGIWGLELWKKKESSICGYFVGIDTELFGWSSGK